MKSEAFNRDCLVAMTEYPDKYFDLALLDPPYGIGESKRVQSRPLRVKQKNGSYLYNSGARKFEKKDWDLLRPDSKYFSEVFRISKNQIIWGGNHFADLLPARSGWIVWDKVNYSSDQSDCELAWTSYKIGVRKFDFMWNGMLQGRSDNGRIAQGNKKLNEKKIHPTQKPVHLYKWVLSNYAKQGWSIIDTHLGSGSSRIAAYDMGFSFTGFEIDKEYFDDQEKRFNDHIKQQKIIFTD